MTLEEKIEKEFKKADQYMNRARTHEAKLKADRRKKDAHVKIVLGGSLIKLFDDYDLHSMTEQELKAFTACVGCFLQDHESAMIEALNDWKKWLPEE